MKDPEAYVRSFERAEVKQLKVKPQKKNSREYKDSPSKKLKAFRKGK